MFSFSLELVIQTWPKEALEVFYTNKEPKEFLLKWGNNLDQKMGQYDSDDHNIVSTYCERDMFYAFMGFLW